jgi:hypothetical protein
MVDKPDCSFNIQVYVSGPTYPQPCQSMAEAAISVRSSNAFAQALSRELL